MKIERLREFLVLARELNFSAAAKLCNIGQPDLSKHIVQIEDELGAKLFIRNRKNVELTEIGTIYVKECEKIVSAYEESLAKVRSEIKRRYEAIRIGFLHLAAQNILADVTAKFETSFPEIKLSLIPNDYSELYEMLEYNRVDMILTMFFQQDLPRDEEYTVVKFGTDHWAAAVCANHPAAILEKISLQSLVGEQLLMASPKALNGFAGAQSKIFHDAGLQVKAASKYNHVREALVMVGAGNGIAVLPTHLKADSPNNVIFTPIEGAEEIDIVAICKKNGIGKQVKNLLDLLAQ